jgi:hypothetical protein
MVVFKPYHCNESTETSIDSNTDEEDSTKNRADNNWTPEGPQPMKRRRRQPPSLKNKLKIMDTSIVMDNTAMMAAYLSAKEQTDYELSL